MRGLAECLYAVEMRGFRVIASLRVVDAGIQPKEKSSDLFPLPSGFAEASAYAGASGFVENCAGTSRRDKTPDTEGEGEGEGIQSHLSKKQGILRWSAITITITIEIKIKIKRATGDIQQIRTSANPS